MIAQYKILLKNITNDEPIRSSWAYWLYSWLIQNINNEFTAKLHENGEKPISQYVYKDYETNEFIWTINLLNEEAISNCSNILENCKEIQLNSIELEGKKINSTLIENNIDLFEISDDNSKYKEIKFLTPTSFKQNGQYVLFPSIWLIIQSSINKWNSFNSDYVIKDKDAENLILNYLHINQYRLRSASYPLKGKYIKGFLGSLTLKENIPAALKEIYNLLINYSQYSGLGIKTTLGMGGIGITNNV